MLSTSAVDLLVLAHVIGNMKSSDVLLFYLFV